MSGRLPSPAQIIRRARIAEGRGPWLVDVHGKTWFDATAGMGKCPLGFNAAAGFGVAQFAEAWTGDGNGEIVAAVRRATKAFWQRKHGAACLDSWFDKQGEPTADNPVRPEPDHPAPLIKAYIDANILDQFDDLAAGIGQQSQQRLAELARRYPQVIRSFDARHLMNDIVLSADLAGRLVSFAADAGILLEAPVGDRVTFRFSLGCRPGDLEQFWNRMAVVVQAMDDTTTAGLPNDWVADYGESQREAQTTLAFHRTLIDRKLAGKKLEAADRQPIVARFLADRLAATPLANAVITVVEPATWPRFRERVAQMQDAVYEPARRTSLKTFDALMACPVHHAIVVELDREIVAIVFAASLSCFPGERGTLDDPARDRPEVVYVADLTVADGFRGGLGRTMKQAITLDAVLAGREAFHGRNRDRLAANMWAINLGLGSYELNHLANDYPDQEKYRDCIYYRCPLRWEREQAARVAAIMERLGEAGVRQRIFELANGR